MSSGPANKVGWHNERSKYKKQDYFWNSFCFNEYSLHLVGATDWCNTVNIGNLVKVHWGNSDYSGVEDVDWGWAPGVIVGEIRYWNKNAEAKKSTMCGDVDVYVQGEVTSYNIGRCKVEV